MSYTETIIEKSNVATGQQLKSLKEIYDNYRNHKLSLESKIIEATNKLFRFNSEDKFTVNLPNGLSYGYIKINHEDTTGHTLSLIDIELPDNWRNDPVSTSNISVQLGIPRDTITLESISSDNTDINIYFELLKKIKEMTSEQINEFVNVISIVRNENSVLIEEYHKNLDDINNTIKDIIMNTVATTPIEFGTSFRGILPAKQVKLYHKNYLFLYPVFVEDKKKTVKLMYTVSESDRGDASFNRGGTMKKEEFNTAIVNYVFDMITR